MGPKGFHSSANNFIYSVPDSGPRCWNSSSLLRSPHFYNPTLFLNVFLENHNQPYYNEPGFESRADAHSSDLYNCCLKFHTVQVSILDTILQIVFILFCLQKVSLCVCFNRLL